MSTEEKGKLEKSQKRRMIVVPDDFSEIDRIGYSEYSAGLVEMVRSVQAEGSFTIGVFGQWGQGKTSMLRQIERELKEYEESGEDDNKGDILTVWFNPWQYTGEEHIIIPFFHTLISFMEDFEKEREKTGKKVAKAAKNFLKELAHVPIALAYGLLDSKFKFSEAIAESRRRKAEIKEGSKSEFQNLVSQCESLYYKLISRLREASKELSLKIVVFIDDLDRCLPEKAVELLEGIKVLLDISGFVFVIGVAREVIERGIRVRYRELYRGQTEDRLFLEQDYLDKIIQFPFTLPPPVEGRLKSMVEDYLQEFKEVKPYLSTIHNALGNNPRSLKRFINNLSYTFWVVGKKMSTQDKGEEFLPELLVKMTLIAFAFPQLYQVIGKTPNHLLRIQFFLKNKEIAEKKVKEKIAETEGDISEKEQLKEEVQNPNDFIEINELNLFEHPRLEIISAILALEKRTVEGEEIEDKGFETEEEVCRYVGLLTVTSTSESAVKSTGNIFIQTMKGRMKNIPSGDVLMKEESSGNEFTASVKSYLIDKYPVTQDLYWKVTGKRPSEFEGDDKPVESISWFEAVEFCNLLSEKTGLKKVYQIEGEEVICDWTAKGFRLPTEVEWEYACRAGSTGDRYGNIDEIAWYDENSGKSTHGVGQKLPNPWGLYDMLGNVWEWCWDWYGEYSVESKSDWRGPDNGSRRVLRGGSWNNTARFCRASYRNHDAPASRWLNYGFRLARSL